MRLDQQPTNPNFSGSGLPMPSNGSSKMASTSSNTRSAAFRSVFTQYVRSSRNCDWKTASRSTRRIKAELPPQLLRRQPLSLALTRLMECSHQPLHVPRRTEQVRGLHQSGQFVGRNQGNILCASAPYNYNLLIVGNLVQDRSQPFSQTRVCCLHWHDELGLQQIMYSIPVRIVQQRWAC